MNLCVFVVLLVDFADRGRRGETLTLPSEAETRWVFGEGKIFMLKNAVPHSNAVLIA